MTKTFGMTMTLLLIGGCAKINTVTQSKEMTTATKAVQQTEQVINEIDNYQENYAKITELFTQSLKSKESSKNFNDANETINTMLKMIACAPKNIEQNNAYKNQLYPYVTKNSSSKKIQFPIASSKKRSDEGECFTIDQMKNYQKLTNNVFTFHTLYSSPKTGTKADIEYRMVKDQKTKQWLFRF